MLARLRNRLCVYPLKHPRNKSIPHARSILPIFFIPDQYSFFSRDAEDLQRPKKQKHDKVLHAKIRRKKPALVDEIPEVNRMPRKTIRPAYNDAAVRGQNSERAS